MGKKLFTNERYEFIKKLLKDNGITSEELAKYSNYKMLRHVRYQRKPDELPIHTDEELLEIVNREEEEDGRQE